jgi:Putative MetA-pathway of phenol degradation
MRRFVPIVVLFGLLASPVHAQHLRDQLSDLFIFGEGEQQLFLGGTADPNNPEAVRIHGNHFVPAAVASNGTIISFLTNSIGSNVSNVPLSATSGGSTFRFEGGVPVRTSTSAGPLFGERALTLGRGRILAGLTRTGVNFKTLRGVALDNLEFTFTHANSDFEGCDEIAGGDCSLLGVPTLENETIGLVLDLDVRLTVTSFLLTYGVTDQVDFGVVLPVVSTTLRGTSTAQINPFTLPPAVHFFGGTPDAPILTAARSIDGSATGLGDVAARLKVNLRRGEPLSVAVLADVRFPTGSDDDLLGSGSFAARGLAIASARFGNFSPHANLGYAYRGGDFETDAVLATFGFDQLMAPWATLAADLVSELQVGTSPLTIPGPVVLESPYRRTISPSIIPDRRDDLVNASLGVKLTMAAGITVIVNGAWPLNRGGLRPDVLWTLGLEYNF